MPIDIHGLQKRYESMPGIELPLIRESVKEFRASLQGRKKELLEPFGLDNLDKFKDNPEGFVKMVGYAVDSFKEKKEEASLYKKVYGDDYCLVTFTNRPEGAAAAGSHLKVEGQTRCPWCICVKHPDNERWWVQYNATALAFIYAKDDACCILLTPHDALETLGGRFTYSQVEGIENTGLRGKPEEQRKVIERVYGKTGLSDTRMTEILQPALEPMRKQLEKIALNESVVAAIKGRNLKRVKECLDLGADIENLTENGWTPLFYATDANHPEICKLLVERGAFVNALDNFKCSPLHLVATNGNLEICKLFIEAGAEVNTTNDWNITPLYWAAAAGSLEVCKLLLDTGADVGFRNKLGNTPLYWAAGRGHLETCKLLIDAGADVNAADKRGVTPLHGAVDCNHLDVCRFLINAGADVNAKNFNGETPLDLAVKKKHTEICQLLIEAGAKQ